MYLKPVDRYRKAWLDHAMERGRKPTSKSIPTDIPVFLAARSKDKKELFKEWVLGREKKVRRIVR